MTVTALFVYYFGLCLLFKKGRPSFYMWDTNTIWKLDAHTSIFNYLQPISVNI